MGDGTATHRQKRDATYLTAVPLVWLLQAESAVFAVGIAPLTEVAPFLGFLAVTLYAFGRRSRLRHAFAAVTTLAAVITLLELAAFLPVVLDSAVWMERMQAVLRWSFPGSLAALGVAHVAFALLCALSFARPGLAGYPRPPRSLVLAAPAVLALHFGLQLATMSGRPPLTLLAVGLMALTAQRMDATPVHRRLATAAAALLGVTAVAELVVRSNAVPALPASPASLAAYALAILCAHAMFAAAAAFPDTPAPSPLTEPEELAA